MSFNVVIADNFHHGVDDEGDHLGTFETLELAIAAAKRIVDKSLANTYRPGMTAAELYDSYTDFGDDPYIVGPGLNGVPFSAWTYARSRCEIVCGPAQGGIDFEPAL